MGMKNILESQKFITLLCLFNKILFSDHLYNALQSKILSNPTLCFGEMQQIITNLSQLRSDQTMESCLQESKEILKCDISESVSATFRRVGFEILDTTVTQLQERFKDVRQLSFVKLVNKNCYSDFVKKFPRQILEELNRLYPNVFDTSKLENELLVVYFCDEKNKLDPLNLLQYIYDNSLEEVFPETYKLLK